MHTERHRAVTDTFQYDVFLSHSAKDKSVVRPLAERLRQDALKVWLDEWEIKPGDSIPAKIEEGLEHSRVLVLCMSASAFASDWAQLESQTFRFRDPLNRDRRFIPLRLDGAPIKGSLAQFLYVDWRPEDREQEYAKLLKACRDPGKWPPFSNNSKPNANMVTHVARLIGARRNEWNRLRTDFETEARKYHDVRMSIFYVDKDMPTPQQVFPHPNHTISLWQYYGSSQSADIVGRLSSETLTDFGVSGAELSAFALVIGQQTNLFCRMATRAGSLVPDQVNHIITGDIAQKFAVAFRPGKPVLVANSNPIAKWLNLMLVATTISHPARFKNGALTADPFAASLTVFDYFRLDE